MANTAFTHDPTITVPSSSTANGVVLWNGTTGKNFSNTNSQHLTFNGVLLDIQNDDSAASEIRLYCDTGNAHYQAIRGGQHSGATSYTMILPHVPPTANQVLTTASISSNVAILDWADAAAIVPTTITVADTTDTTAFVGLFESATGNLPPKTDGALTYNASSGTLAATEFSGGGGNLTGISAGASVVGTYSGNQVITANSQTELNGEADLTFDGGTLLFSGSAENTIKVTTSTSDAPANIQIAAAAGGTGNAGANLYMGEGALDGTTGDKAYRFSYLSNVDYFRFGSVESGDVWRVNDGGKELLVAENNSYPSVTKGIAKHWVRFNPAATGTLIASYNTSSVTDTNVGNWTVVLSTHFANGADCVIVGQTQGTSGGHKGITLDGVPATSEYYIGCFDDADTRSDPDFVHMVAFGEAT